MNKNNFQNIDEYIACFSLEIQEKLQLIRKTIKEACPEATEKISYQMPTFYLHGNLVHFASMKNHIGFYPGSSGVANFLDELSKYQTSKGTIQIPYDQELPLELITRIVKFRANENLNKASKKARKQ